MIQKVKKNIRILKNIQSSTEDGDIGGFRIKRMMMTTFSGLVNKVISSSVALLSVPLSLNYLGTERYSFMITLVSILTMVAFADLGLGFGLQNRIPILKNDTNELKKAVSSTFFFLCAMTLLMSIIAMILLDFVEWRTIFNAKENISNQEIHQSIIAFFACILVAIPFSFVQRLQIGYQEGYINELWASLGNIFSLVFLYAAIFSKAGIPYIILSLYGTPSFFVFCNFCYHFLYKRRELMPSFHFINRLLLFSLVKEGLVFFAIALMYSLATSYDNLLIVHFLNPESVVLYSIGFRLCSLASTPVNIYSASILPAFNDALEHGDKNWAKKILRKSIKYVFLFSTGIAAVLFFTFNRIISFWVGKDYDFSPSLLVSFCLFIVYSGVHSLCSFTMLSKHFIKWLLIIFPMSFIMVLGFKILFIHRFGLDGLILGTILGFFFTFHIPSFFKLKASNLI